MKKLISQYNKGLPSDSQMSWEAASNLHKQTYRAALISCISDSIPLDVKYEAVRKWRLVERCREEIYLLKTEMQNCIDFFSQRIRMLQSLQECIMYAHGQTDTYVIRSKTMNKCFTKPTTML